MADVSIIIRTIINPTESREKVERTITNLFGQVKIQLKEEGGYVYLEARSEGFESLRQLRERIARDRIRDATRSMLSRWATKVGKVEFQLNKQAAFAGHVSMYHANKGPLGPIEVEIKGSPEEVIAFICG